MSAGACSVVGIEGAALNEPIGGTVIGGISGGSGAYATKMDAYWSCSSHSVAGRGVGAVVGELGKRTPDGWLALLLMSTSK